MGRGSVFRGLAAEGKVDTSFSLALKPEDAAFEIQPHEGGYEIRASLRRGLGLSLVFFALGTGLLYWYLGPGLPADAKGSPWVVPVVGRVKDKHGRYQVSVISDDGTIAFGSYLCKEDQEFIHRCVVSTLAR